MYHSFARQLIREAHKEDPELSAIETDLRNALAELDNADDIAIPLQLYVHRLAIAIYQIRQKCTVAPPQPGLRVAAVDVGNDVYYLGRIDSLAPDGLHLVPRDDVDVLIPWAQVNDILQRR